MKAELRLPSISDKVYMEVMKLGINDRETVYNHISASLIYNRHILTQIRHKDSKKALEDVIKQQERELEVV